VRADQPIASARPGLTRGNLFLGLFLLAGLNALAGQALRDITFAGFGASLLNLFGVSAIVWAALAAAAKILTERPLGQLPRRLDYAIGAIVLVAALLPFSTASMLALTALSLYAIGTSPAGSGIRRAAIIFLAMSGVLIWGRLMLAAFSTTFLEMDALFVSLLLGTEHQGNLLWYDGYPTRLVVAPGCSSMQGISLSILLWATINQLFEIRFGWKSALWCLAAVAATIAVNVVRIGSMLSFPAYLDELHHGWGVQLFMWLTFAAVAAICLYGGRRHVFARV
jgi:exosortase/archaeosortase family protein